MKHTQSALKNNFALQLDVEQILRKVVGGKVALTLTIPMCFYNQHITADKIICKMKIVYLSQSSLSDSNGKISIFDARVQQQILSHFVTLTTVR